MKTAANDSVIVTLECECYGEDRRCEACGGSGWSDVALTTSDLEARRVVDLSDADADRAVAAVAAVEGAEEAYYLCVAAAEIVRANGFDIDDARWMARAQALRAAA
jgi:hypothetical protein